MRGAERAFAAIAECWPEAPILTLLHDPRGTECAFSGRSIETSYLQRLHVNQDRFRWLLPFFPRAAEALPVEPYDLIISSTSAFAHGVRPRPDATHIAYCYTPFRYAWHERHDTALRAPSVVNRAIHGGLERMRRWDIEASRRVTHYMTISELSRRRIQDSYGRDATIVHPPVEVDRFSIGEPEDFFLVVAELVPHKRVENALEAARRARVPLKVVGGGPALKQLQRDYGSTATFLGRVCDEEIAALHRRARALVVPNVEEFGIAAVEAQASGRPVLGADAGGVSETVVAGETGVLVPPDDVEALAEAMRDTDWERFDPQRIREHSLGFSTSEFKRRFHAEVMRLAGHPSRRQGPGGAKSDLRPAPLGSPPQVA